MDFRSPIYAFLQSLSQATAEGARAALAERCTADTVWHPPAPLSPLISPDVVCDGLILPLRRAIPTHLRRDEIVIGGRTRMGDGDWVAAMGHYVGNLEAPLFGVPAHGKLVFLRYGEFYRIENGRISEARLIWDLVDLMRQCGHPVLPAKLGAEMLFPGPATHDGVLPNAPTRSDASAELVEAMLRDLSGYDADSFDSPGQSGPGGYWDPQMLWFGPGGIGSNFSYAGFLRDHRIPFLTAFPDRIGGNHFSRFGDGDYVCSGGWPSMTMTHRGPYLGVAPTGRKLSLRVMDFWRCAGGQIAENWVLLDYVDLFAQMGVDLLDGARDDGA